MRQSRLSCITYPSLIAGLITLLLIAGVGFARGGVMFNPGDLNAQGGIQPLGGVFSHAETGSRCAACHTAFWDREIMSDRCLACHSHLLDDIKDFHAVMLAQSNDMGCNDCHTDHRGVNISLTTFSMQHFPHNDASSYSLQSHKKMADGALFTCADCHGPEIGLFDQVACETCHSNLDSTYSAAHIDVFGKDCLACHDGIDSYGKDFSHNKTAFVLQGKHAETTCDACHQQARTLADLISAPQDCYSCHIQDDAHQGNLGQECANCHTPDEWEQVTFNHNQTNYPLAGKHINVACQDCHLEGVFSGTPQSCLSCHAHDDAHNGQFDHDCTVCHTPEDWDQTTFDHSQSNYPLTGAHSAVDCALCHLDSVYVGTSNDCYACHSKDDAHDGRFGQDCALCHTTDTWKGATFDHTLATFQLTGAHINVDCTECHVNNVFQGTSQSCAACHADPAYHRGAFIDDCDTCHNTSAWLPGRFNLPHSFPTNHGNRGGSSCSMCHPSSLVSYSCYGCHEHSPSEIEKKHREEGIKNFQNCLRCHPDGREHD